MSNRNRRDEASTGKQSTSRLSRIAVPTRRPSMRERSLERASSVERISNAPYQTASSIKRLRSTSATPSRTPCRPVPFPGANVQVTNEKQRMPLDDKKFIQQQTVRITEYLQENDNIVGKDFHTRGGFKSMSTKQFIDIFSHLVKFVVGNRAKIEKNYVEDIVSLLAQIEYPFTVNKSWLKTPAAPHALNHIIILFGWLLDFAPTSHSVAEFENEYLVVKPEFPDMEYALMFNNWAKVGFSLWNNSEDEEFTKLKCEIMNVLLQKETNSKCLAELQNEIRHISNEAKRLDPRKSKNEYREKRSTMKDERKQLDSKIHITKMNIAKTEKNCEENQKTIVQLEQHSERNQEHINENQRRIESLESAIKTQKMTKNERAEFISHIQYLKQVLDAKRKTIIQLQDVDASNQVLYSRLVKQKIDAVAAFNSHLQLFFAEQSIMVDVNVEELYIDQNPEVAIDEQIQIIEPLLEKIKQATFDKIKAHAEEISDLEHKLKKVVYEHDTVLEEQLKCTQQKCDEYSTSIEELDVEMVNTRRRQDEQMNELRSMVSGQVARVADREKEIATRKEEIDRWERENREIWEYADNKLAAYNEAKRRNVARLEEHVEKFHVKMEDIKRKMKDMGFD